MPARKAWNQTCLVSGLHQLHQPSEQIYILVEILVNSTNAVSILRKPYNSPYPAPLTCLENLTSFLGHPPFCSPLALPPSFGASDQLSPLLGAGGQHALQAPNDPPPHAK